MIPSLERIFHVDILTLVYHMHVVHQDLPVVGMMCGASPLDPPAPAPPRTPAPSQPSAKPSPNSFAAFAQNFAGGMGTS